MRLPARARLRRLIDGDTFAEEDCDLVGGDPLAFEDALPYTDRLAAAQRRTGLTEAVLTGRARLGGHAVRVAVFDFGFLGGSMGVAVGERLVRLFERATRARQPVIVVATSGGARMQEGTLALSQMARVAAAVERHHAAGLLYISVLADPTAGGVMVSPASMGDIVLAEPGAYAAFAGRRVSGETVPMGAEWLESRGMLDGVVARPELRATVIRLLELLTGPHRSLQRRWRPSSVEISPSRKEEPNAWTAVELVRREDRPGAREYVDGMTEEFVELHGDRLYGDDESILAGVTRFAGQPAVILGQDRHRPAGGSHPPGRPYPEGFRKVLRLVLLAAKFGLPIVTLIDTAGAQADAEAEGRGLAFAIGRCLRIFSAVPVPVVAAIVGEGGSGGALALAVADRVLMLEHAVYEVINPEGAAAILYHDGGRPADLAARMRITARDALALGVVDAIVPEPPGGANADPGAAMRALSDALCDALAESQRWLPDHLVERRYRRLRSIGTPYLQRRSTVSETPAEAEPPPAVPEMGQA
jgi:acetyl-CoA carboxylase carboxyl transferase subunit beta